MSSEENKALVLRWFAETDQGNLAIVDELLPVDYIDHNPPLPGLPAGREGVRQSILLLRATRALAAARPELAAVPVAAHAVVLLADPVAGQRHAGAPSVGQHQRRRGGMRRRTQQGGRAEGCAPQPSAAGEAHRA